MTSPQTPFFDTRLSKFLLALLVLLGSALSVPRLQAQGPMTVSVSVLASPVPQGEHVPVQIAVNGCSPSCATATIFIDGNYAGGTGISSDGTIGLLTLDTVPVGAHGIQVRYDDPSGTPSWSPVTNFSVVTNTLPKPRVTLQLTPAVPVAGSWINLTLALSCGSGCGGGGGPIILDGQYAGFNYLDGNGNASFWMPPDSRFLQAGRHTAQYLFFGNPAYSNIFSPPIVFDVLPPNAAQPVSISIEVPASPFPEGETVGINIKASCGPNCATSTLLVDGVSSGGTGLSADGTVSTAGLATVAQGDHIIQATYDDPAGLRSAVSPGVSFTVLPNTLPKPAESITVSPGSPMSGSTALITVALSCGTGCGAGGGQLSIDNRYAGFNVLDGGGQVAFYTNLTSPFDAVGTHTVSFNFFGNAAYSNVFPAPVSFTVSAPPVPAYDAGQVTLTVNGVQETVPYNQTRNATSGALASALASAVNADPNAAASAFVSGSSLNLTAKTPGAATNYAYSVSSTYDTADFAQPSFTAAPANGNLAGGSDASTGSGAPQTVYGYSILKPDGTSGYAPNGNLLAYTDSVTGTWSFGYDSLNRLTAGSTTSPMPDGHSFYCWNYDSFGNRLNQTGADRAMADPANCVAATGSNYTLAAAVYDAANRTIALNNVAVPAPDASGNTTDDGTHQFLYDPEGRVCAERGATVAGITPMVQYLYDAEGRRVAKGRIAAFSCDSTANGFQLDKQYLLGPSGEQLTELNGDGSWAHTNVYAAGSMIATFENDGKGAHFHFTDWLGTRRAQTDYTGKLEATYTSLPFGDGLASTGAVDPTEHHFTGKERDTESGLDYFKYRMYASNMGRWMSPDPSGLTHADLGNPQSLNLYNYVGNNPLSRTDLDGLCWKGFQWACNAAQALDNGVHGLGFQTNTSVNREQHNANQLLHHDGVQTEGLSRRQVRKAYRLDMALGSVRSEGDDGFTYATRIRPTAAQARAIWEKATGGKVPYDESMGRFYDMAHKTPIGDGGSPRDPANLEPMLHSDHMDSHRENGDFARWGARSGTPGEPSDVTIEPTMPIEPPIIIDPIP